MQHVIAWRFWSFLLNRRQGVIGSHIVIKLSLLLSVMNTSLFSRFHPISKIHWVCTRFFMFRSRWTIRTNWFSLFALGELTWPFSFVYFSVFYQHVLKTIKVTFTNKRNRLNNYCYMLTIHVNFHNAQSWSWITFSFLFNYFVFFVYILPFLLSYFC